MKIGIYKPLKTVTFGLSEDVSAAETAAWSYEVVTLYHIIKSAGHDVFMLSPFDGDQAPQQDLKYSWITNDFKLDRIIIVGGDFKNDRYDQATLIKHLRERCDRLDLLVTDQKLVPDFITTPENKFDRIYTQGKWLKDGSHFIPSKRSYTEELIVYYRNNLAKTALASKTTKFYFGGGERGRTRSFFEYVYRPGHHLSIKSPSLGIDDRVGFEQHTRYLQYAKYTIIIADEAYNQANFLIPRQYEAWMANTIAFVEKDYDTEGLSIPEDHYLRVSSFVEMTKKMRELNADPKLAQSLLDWQKEQITEDRVNGVNIKNALKI